MSALELTFEELERIFWTSGAPEAFAKGHANCYQAAFIRKAAMPDLIILPENFYFEDHPPGYLPIPHERALFILTVRDFGPAKFVAVTSGEWLIVSPLPIDDIADLPNMRPTEEFA